MKQPGLKNFILAKNWSRDPLFVVISFLPILSTSFEFSTSHAFHLFKLIFSVVTFLCSSVKKKYQRNKRKKSKNPKKILIDKKERSKSETTGLAKIYFGQKLVKRSSFRGHKFYVNFEHIL